MNTYYVVGRVVLNTTRSNLEAEALTEYYNASLLCSDSPVNLAVSLAASPVVLV